MSRYSWLCLEFPFQLSECLWYTRFRCSILVKWPRSSGSELYLKNSLKNHRSPSPFSFPYNVNLFRLVKENVPSVRNIIHFAWSSKPNQTRTINEANNWGAELPAAIKVAPATSEPMWSLLVICSSEGTKLSSHIEANAPNIQMARRKWITTPLCFRRWYWVR